ncbi:hypothetical protein NDI85_19775 [Halomicroarcula sp. S1AR25-4]|uniref:hypothetical protein n=1 Tax=Haloarcula sp. S1AR25-4 TaxID=2950538 RepID=UPI0028761817|nr:hypothetical protein [Halomicroarcula sp. S1AR25-4]MDS0280028.1 hypothetical protein [Halomicroarcula sp. S1AR25-4]
MTDTTHISDADIEQAIDGEVIDDATEVRDALATFQRSAAETWAEHMDGIEDGHYTVVKETRDVVVLAVDGPRYSEYLAPTDHDTDELVSAVSATMHVVARRLTDWSWSVTSPLVIRKPQTFDAGQQFTEAVVNGLQQEGLSPGQAWAYYGVEIRGNSMNSWGIRKGDHDHKNVSDALEKAREKLPR